MKTDSLPSLNVIYQTDTEIKGASTLTLKKCQKLLTFLCYLVVVGGEFNLQVDKGNVLTTATGNVKFLCRCHCECTTRCDMTLS